jgi:putative peptidoglycan lipid II flippase
MNVVLSFLLFHFISFIGIVLSTTIAAWTNTIQLGLCLWRRGHFTPDAQLKRRLPLVFLASVGMGAVLWVGSILLEPIFRYQIIASIIVLIALVLSGFIVYIGFCELTGAAHYTDIRRIIKRC